MFLFPLSSHGSLVTGNLEVSFIDIYVSWSFKGETAAEMYPKGDVLNKSVQNVPVCVIAQWEKWWGQGREVKERECPIRARGMFCNGDKWCSHWLEMGEASFLFLKFVFNWRTIALQHCVVSAIGQHESAVNVHTSPPSWCSLPLPSPPHPTPLGCHRSPPWALCYTAASHRLSISHAVTYMFQGYSFGSSHPLLPALCTVCYVCIWEKLLNVSELPFLLCDVWVLVVYTM